MGSREFGDAVAVVVAVSVAVGSGEWGVGSWELGVAVAVAVAVAVWSGEYYLDYSIVGFLTSKLRRIGGEGLRKGRQVAIFN